MTSKNISITEEIYKKLVCLKSSNESFSDVIQKLIQTQNKDPLAHFGILADSPPEELMTLQEGIELMKKSDTELSTKKIKQMWGIKE